MVVVDLASITAWALTISPETAEAWAEAFISSSIWTTSLDTDRAFFQLNACFSCRDWWVGPCGRTCVIPGPGCLPLVGRKYSYLGGHQNLNQFPRPERHCCFHRFWHPWLWVRPWRGGGRPTQALPKQCIFTPLSHQCIAFVMCCTIELQVGHG